MKSNLNINVLKKNSAYSEEVQVMLRYSTSYWDFLDKMELSRGNSNEQ
jgi:hypothetical protein